MEAELLRAGIDKEYSTVDSILAKHSFDNLVDIANQCYYYGSTAIPVYNDNSLNCACAGDSVKALRFLLEKGCEPNDDTLPIICANNSERAMSFLMKKFPKLFKQLHPDILNQLYESGYYRMATILVQQCRMTRKLAYVMAMKANIKKLPDHKFNNMQLKNIIWERALRGDWILAREAYTRRNNKFSMLDKLLVACCKGDVTSVPWLIGIGARMDYRNCLPYRLLCAHNPDMAIEFATWRPAYSGPSIYTVWRNGDILTDQISARNSDVIIDFGVCNFEPYRIARRHHHRELSEYLPNM
jgi:hypothetical protein